MKQVEEKKTDIYLSDLKKGDEGIIERFDDHNENLVRLGDMGLREGIAFRIVKFAPLGDPIEIKIRGFYLSIRKSQAKRIRVIKKENGDL